jgi:hypothetical protein
MDISTITTIMDQDIPCTQEENSVCDTAKSKYEQLCKENEQLKQELADCKRRLHLYKPSTGHMLQIKQLLPDHDDMRINIQPNHIGYGYSIKNKIVLFATCKRPQTILEYEELVEEIKKSKLTAKQKQIIMYNSMKRMCDVLDSIYKMATL